MNSGFFDSIRGRLRRANRRKRNLRTKLDGVLAQVRNIRFAPATVIDVGAAYGDFAISCQRVFPEARYLLIEPLSEYAAGLETVVAKLPAADFIPAAAASEDGEITINVHGDLVGSSLYLEQEDSAVNGVPRTVTAVTLDSLWSHYSLQPPFLLKIDVQGAELDVLDGAAEVLRHTGYALLEVSLFEFFAGGPQLHDVIVYMKQRGFSAYDISGFQYRPLDGALSQLDISFVRDDGEFRSLHSYATQAQREAQDRSLGKRRKRESPQG